MTAQRRAVNRKERDDDKARVSEYCDRWCERCAFTERCSSFALQAAIAMCDGNFEEALELAVGRPQPVSGQRSPSIAEHLPDDILDPHISDSEIREISRELDERRKRIAASPALQAAHDYGIAASRWLRDNARCAFHRPESDLREAIAVVVWDAHLIEVKLQRALNGKDEFSRGNPLRDHRVQNDWNGSAKVALILIARSEESWVVVHRVVGDSGSAALEASLKTLASSVRAAFPDAVKFRRPGFDGE